MTMFSQFRRLRRDWVWRGIVRLKENGAPRNVTIGISGDAARSIALARRGAAVEVELSATHAVLPLRRQWGDDDILALPAPSDGVVRLAVRGREVQGAETSILLRAVGDEGRRLGHVTLQVSERRDWLLRTPPGTTHLSLSLRLGSAGLVQPFALALHGAEQEAAAAFDLPRVAMLQPAAFDPAALARTLYAGRRYEAVLDMQRRPWLQTDSVNRVALVSLVQMRRFEEALAFHRRWAPPGAAGAGWDRPRFEALGNLGRGREIMRVVRARLRDADSPARGASLLKALPYVAGDARLRDAVLSALEDAVKDLPPGDPSVIDAANRTLLLGRRSGPLFQLAVNDIRQGVEDRLMLQAQAAFVSGDAAGQLAGVNAVLAAHALTPIRAEGPMKVCGLSTAPMSRRSGPPVSVIVTAFNSADTIGYAIKSLAAQTHDDLEIILIDDASTDETAALAREAAQGRAFRLSRQSENRGPYACRNIGLDMAQGRFVVCHDADDWAHPQKVERLVETILANTDRVAAWNQALRLSPDRGFVTRGGFLAMEGPSLMFEREPVLAAIGPFEPVRAGGDGEFHRRLELHFGLDRIGVCPAPLTVMAVRAASLSRSGPYAIDEETGVFSARRNAYRRDYLRRHAARFERPDAG